ncbi:DNA polymerase III alpha subunit [hydrothermal vent metagenome]|uniref:DNA polymerase III subunit alpha n=1 Tax=hydrothermal vent metagenome TaxID=652676 RepID=A0A3B1C124_9ZZZZ
MSDFIHLHNHTHYSLQDAACTVDGLINEAVANQMDAIALTDHGVMYGISEFYKKAKKAGIKPIIGCEVYITRDGSRFERGSEGSPGRSRKKHYNHIVLLAKNKVGYQNLMKLTTQGFTEGFYYKPRIDMELLKERSEGLVCTSACLAGPVSSLLLNNDYDKAREVALQYKELFGDDFYLELQDHGLENDQAILQGMPKLSKELGIKLVATNDIHYIKKEHSIAHNILLLLGDKKGDSDYKELRYRTDQVYFKSSEEMTRLFKHYDGAIENTLEIAEKCNVSLDFEGFHYPIFPIPEGSKAKDLDEYFTQLAREGLEKRFKKINKDIEDRFDYELGVIKSMGYSGYFLITQDFINAAKKSGIPVGPGRGSAAGSLVAYALGITSVNPLQYDLLFERFLNPARQSMPDIDVDFADDQREDVIKYTKDRYGENSVAQIVTFNRLSSKAVLRDVARVLKIPISTVNSITKWIPSKFGKVYTIEKALNEVHELKWVRESNDPQITELIKYAKILEGMNRNASKHAAGVVITPGDVSDFVPLARAGNDGGFVTQFNMKELDDAGILKMDFLGLRTLTIIRDTITLVKKTRGIDIDIDSIPEDDKKAFALFGKGQTTGIFQFESGAMREYLKNLKPESIQDLAAMNALYRPGPMEFIGDFIDRRHGRKQVKYLHPVLEPILKETYGIIVYQEQVIQIANKVGGMSLAEADLLRRAMGKKNLEVMAQQKKKFIEGAVKNNIPEKVAEGIFVHIDKFANYGFNKSHAVAYSYVAYQTAYLKANYLAEFLAANLTNEFGNTAKVTLLLDECRKMHVQVLPPNVNKPSVFFNVEDGKIIFGMSAIKNVGPNAVEELKSAREKLGRDFISIYDLCANVDTRVVNKRVLEGLVLAGGFDSIKGTRAQNFAAIEDALNYGSKYQSAKESMSNSLFGGTDESLKIIEPDLPELPPWDFGVLLAKERETLGFYLSDHPLRKFELEYRSFATVHLGEPDTFGNKEFVVAVGVVTDMRTKIDRSGRTMAFFKLDDLTGSCECLMFSKNYEEFGTCIKTESTVMVKGKVESSGDAIKLHVDESYPLEEVREKFTAKLLLYTDDKKHDNETIKKIKEILDEHIGDTPVYLSVRTNGGKRDFYLDRKIKLEADAITKLLKLLGENGLRYLT